MTKKEQQELNKQLLDAVYNNNLAKVKELLKAGADIEAKDEDVYGYTSLQWASFNGNLELVKELLGRGAELDAKDNDGKTALYIASFKYNVPIIKELLGRGAELDLQTLSKYPKESLINIHKKVKMEDKWSSAFMFIIREKDKYSDSEFKDYILAFLEKTKNEMPENIYIILNTLI